MPVLEDKLFIDKTAFGSYKDISEHMDDDLMDAYIREAQVVDLQAFLGPQLYLLLQDDFTFPDTWLTPKYDDLFNGVDYAYRGKVRRQHGLQPMLTLFAYARMLDNLQMSVTRIGPVTYTSADTSEPPTQAQIKTKVISSRAMAVKYGEEVELFLSSNRSDYPEWEDKQRRNKTCEFEKL